MVTGDLLSRLVRRALAPQAEVQPVLAPLYAPGPVAGSAAPEEVVEEVSALPTVAPPPTRGLRRAAAKAPAPAPAAVRSEVPAPAGPSPLPPPAPQVAGGPPPARTDEGDESRAVGEARVHVDQPAPALAARGSARPRETGAAREEARASAVATSEETETASEPAEGRKTAPPIFAVGVQEAAEPGPRRAGETSVSVVRAATRAAEAQAARGDVVLEAERESVAARPPVTGRAETRTQSSESHGAPPARAPEAHVSMETAFPIQEDETEARAASPPVRRRQGRDEAAAPVIRVTIGRVEVRAVTASAPAPPAPAAADPGLSLDAYLAQQQGGGR